MTNSQHPAPQYSNSEEPCIERIERRIDDNTAHSGEIGYYDKQSAPNPPIQELMLKIKHPVLKGLNAVLMTTLHILGR